MKTIEKLQNLFTNKNAQKTKGKKEANLNYNATLYFQVSLILAIALVALIINATYAVKIPQVTANLPEEIHEEWMSDFVIIKPKTEIVKKQKVIKKQPPIANRIPQKPIDRDIKLTPTKPTLVAPQTTLKIPTKPKTPETKVYSLLNVERVPVFPGCEPTSSNNELKNCMSKEMGKLINRHFNANLAANHGLKGRLKIDVSFVINTRGEVSNIKVRAPHPILENEAKRLVKLIPKMLPGMQNNNQVEVMFNLPIVFDVVD